MYICLYDLVLTIWLYFTCSLYVFLLCMQTHNDIKIVPGIVIYINLATAARICFAVNTKVN